MAKNTQTVSDEQIISALMTAGTAQKAAEMCGIIRWTDDIYISPPFAYNYQRCTDDWKGVQITSVHPYSTYFRGFFV